MPMSRARKEQEVKAIHEMLLNSETVVVAHNEGLSVSEDTEYRSQLREAGGLAKVTKNTLALRALEGTQFDGLSDMFKGPTRVAVSQDPVAAAKVTYEFAKKHDKLVIVGGAYGGRILDKAGVEQLAKMPSLDELRAKIAGLLQAPAQKMAGVMQAPAGDLARVVGAYAAKGE